MKPNYRLIIFLPFLVLILLRIPSLFESYWYGDEGIYAAVATEMSRGKELYAQTWDHKPPFIFWFFYPAAVFGWESGFVLLRAVNIILGTLSLLGLNLVLKKAKFNFYPRFVSLLFLSIVLGSTILEGNVVNAEVIFIVFNIFFLLFVLSKKYFIPAGFLLFLSLFTKVPGFVELALISVVFGIIWLKEKGFSFALISFSKIAVGFVVPLALTLLYFLLKGTISDFYYANLAFNRIYSLHEGNFVRLLTFNFPSTYLQLVSVISVLSLSTILYLKKKTSSVFYIFINLFTVQFFASLLSAKNYGHYFIQMLPGIAFLLAFFLQNVNKISIKKNFMTFVVFVIFLIPLVYILNLGGRVSVYAKPAEYYPWFFRGFVLGQDEFREKFWWREGPGVRKTVESAKYIEDNYLDHNLVYIYTDKPWIIALANRNYSNKYVVWFHLRYRNEHLQEDLVNIQRADLLAIDNDITILPPVSEQIQQEFEKIDQFASFGIFRKKN
jgi:hypothetical protein